MPIRLLGWRAGAPLILIYGADTPPRSRAEVEALSGIPGVSTARPPRGTLALHEKFPQETAELVAPLLAATAPAATAWSR